MAVPRIQKLDEVVINRIAAGEVVQKPSAAIKEMLENSIDAGSTSITITAKSGGMELLQIQDNGHGIQFEDLPILCERFTTSKLSCFDDLKTIQTFGFRGEALASITHVANVVIQSRTATSPCAYKARYSDGKLVPIKSGDKADPKPCAGVVGTTITVEDLFHNMPARKQAFKNYAEQYQKILDVVTRYSIHYANRNISFICKKQGQLSADLQTPNNSNVSENIRIVYGASLAQELLDLNLSSQEEGIQSNVCVNAEGCYDQLFDNDADVVCHAQQQPTININSSKRVEFKLKGKVSNANYSSKKSVFILFINNRLVENNSIKRAVDAVYSDLLPKHCHPFVYLSLDLPPQHVDVNVHPTKKEVHFLYEDVIVNRIYERISELLRGANTSRVFHVQPMISGSYSSLPVSVEPTAATISSRGVIAALPHSANIVAPDINTLGSEDPGEGADYTETRSALYESSTFDNLTLPQTQTASSKRKISETASQSQPARSSALSVSQSTPAHKFVRTDPKQLRINEIFKQIDVDPGRNSGSATGITTLPGSSPGTSRPIKHRIGCSAIDMTLCAEVSPQNRSNILPATQDPLGLAEHQCRCCVDNNDIGIDDDDAVDIVANRPGTQSDNQTVVENSDIAKYEIVETRCQYSSIRTMISDMHSDRNASLESMLRSHSFVGVVDSTSCLIQVGVKLLLVDYSSLIRKMFSQIVIRMFGEFSSIKLTSPISVRRSLQAGLAKWTTPGSRDELLSKYTDMLTSNAEMLREYFQIGIDDTGCLASLPQLLPGYIPELEAIPLFLAMLCRHVNWTEESQCFRDISHHIGMLYSYLPEAQDPYHPTTEDSQPHAKVGLLTAEGKTKLQELLYPALRRLYIPSNQDNEDMVQVASLEDLYKVFERC